MRLTEPGKNVETGKKHGDEHSRQGDGSGNEDK